MDLFIGCTLLQLTGTGIMLSIISIVISCFSIWFSWITSKRYTSGTVDVTFRVLDPRLLEKTAEILNKASHGNSDGNPDLCLYMNEGNEYGEVWETLFNLNMLAVLMLDDALPKKINEVARNHINKYLSRKQVWAFVNANKNILQALYEIKESKASVS